MLHHRSVLREALPTYPTCNRQSGVGHIENAYHMKSVQWLQKVGCLKNRAMNLWSFTTWTFFCLSAPLRANLLATSEVVGSFTSVMSPDGMDEYRGSGVSAGATPCVFLISSCQFTNSGELTAVTVPVTERFPWLWTSADWAAPLTALHSVTITHCANTTSAFQSESKSMFSLCLHDRSNGLSVN